MDGVFPPQPEGPGRIGREAVLRLLAISTYRFVAALCLASRRLSPDGADEDTLLALAEAQDIIERGDVHSKQGALALRLLAGAFLKLKLFGGGQ
jgi:hypothetical protein